MPHRRHHAKTGSASIIGAIAGLLLLACALFAVAFSIAGVVTIWLGMPIGVACASVGITLIVRHLRSHHIPSQGQP